MAGPIVCRHRPGVCRRRHPSIYVSVCGLGPQSLLIDIGCGTGISSRPIAAAASGVASTQRRMRGAGRPKASQRRVPVGLFSPPRFSPRAEATALLTAWPMLSGRPSRSLVRAGVGPARIPPLAKVGGWTVLNVERTRPRPMPSPCLRRHHPLARKRRLMENSGQRAGDALLRSSLFHHAHRVNFRQEQMLDERASSAGLFRFLTFP